MRRASSRSRFRKLRFAEPLEPRLSPGGLLDVLLAGAWLAWDDKFDHAATKIFEKASDEKKKEANLDLSWLDESMYLWTSKRAAAVDRDAEALASVEADFDAWIEYNASQMGFDAAQSSAIADAMLVLLSDAAESLGFGKGDLIDTTVTTSSMTGSPPDAVNDFFSTIHDMKITNASVATNDLNYAMGGSFSIVSGPSSGSLTRYLTNGVWMSGNFDYMPNFHFVGTDQFTYRITTPFGTDTAIATINVTNNAPTAVNNQYDLAWNVAVEFNAAEGVLANDIDPDGGDKAGLTAQLVSSPSHGTLNLRSNGSFAYGLGRKFCNST